jgi:magnesium chelatase family protein
VQLQRADRTNAQLDSADLKAFCRTSTANRKLLAEASKQHALSLRACLRILKVARTLADLEAESNIGTAHVAEAISYRKCGAMLTMKGHI